VRDYSKSEFADKGKQYLEKLGKPIPEPGNDNPAPERPNMMGKFKLIIGNNGLAIPEDGVLLSKKGQEKEEVKESAKPSEASVQQGTRAVRATTKGQIPANQTDAAPASAAPNGPNGANDTQTTAPTAKGGEPKKEEKKNSNKKKEKKGFLGGVFK
jgi:hypothetical protein